MNSAFFFTHLGIFLILSMSTLVVGVDVTHVIPKNSIAAATMCASSVRSMKSSTAMGSFLTLVMMEVVH